MLDETGAKCNIEAVDQPLVYVGMVGDILHAGHINILTVARALGRVVVGVITDEAATTYKRLPFLRFAQRKVVFENMRGVHQVVAQETLSYRPNLLKLRPHYVVHGDDWCNGPLANVREEVIDTLKGWGGELVEVPYTPGVSSTMFYEALREQGILARSRQSRFRLLLSSKNLVRVIGVHSTVAALIAEKAKVNDIEFDGFWSSSLADSLMHGKPDIEVLDSETRLSSLSRIMQITSRPVFYDGESGGTPEALFYLSRRLDGLGVSALCLEDKRGRKCNSLYGTESRQLQADKSDFCDRLRTARSAIPHSSMMIIARIESLVLGKPMSDALARAEAYCQAGADGVLIHSVASTSQEVFAFARHFKSAHDQHLFVIPTTFDETYEHELIDHSVQCVVYANQLIRASYRAIAQAADDILTNGRSAELRNYSASVQEILALIPEPKC